MFARRSLVLEDAEGAVSGYFLSIPMVEEATELLLQVAVEQRARGSAAAKELLRRYYSDLRAESIARSVTSVH